MKRVIKRFEIVKLLRKIMDGEWNDGVFNMVVRIKMLLMMDMNIRGVLRI